MSTKKEIKVYKTTEGKTPFFEWRNSFKDKIVRARINRRLERLEDGNYGDCKSVGDGVFEMRLHFGPGYRIYFGEVGAQVILLLLGGNKNGQTKDIQLAKQYWQEFTMRVKQ
jgi:putative addiction module killer protein